MHVGKSTEPRIHIIQDMDNQERFKAQQASSLFADGRAMRPPVEGTVARGELHPYPHELPGMIDGAFMKTFPDSVKVTEEFIVRGQNRFAINCAPCHGIDGGGNGPVAIRAIELAEPAWVAPLDLASDQVRERSIGHLFHTVTSGIRNMPPYGDLISEQDRWAIVAYVRALQRARHAAIEDVPADKRTELNRQ